MPKTAEHTRERLLEAATALVAEECLSQISIENIAERAGVSRRTFFAYFPSKDHLLAAVVDFARPIYLDRYRVWADACGPDASMVTRVTKIFSEISKAASNPNWKGCCFIRMTAELGHMKGHPVHGFVAQATLDMERWFADELAREGYEDCSSLAKQIVVMINGLLMVQLVTRSTSYGSEILPLVRAILSVKDDQDQAHRTQQSNVFHAM